MTTYRQIKWDEPAPTITMNIEIFDNSLLGVTRRLKKNFNIMTKEELLCNDSVKQDMIRAIELNINNINCPNLLNGIKMNYPNTIKMLLLDNAELLI